MLHYTFDEYDKELSSMYEHIENEIVHAKKDISYYNAETLKLVLKLRDTLSQASSVALTLSLLINKNNVKR
jgi:hypothetical protein